MSEMPHRHVTLESLARDLASGQTTSVALTAEYLDRIKEPSSEGTASFTRTYEACALQEADVSDRLRAHGRVPSPLAGIPISIKDLFDVAGDVTTAGSVALAEAPVATADALAVARLRAAGAIVIGKSNMTEFAYSALGLNPHYGTPRNPCDPARIPGGSSSGAAAAVAFGLCAASVGTDTAGSVRVPAAFCGLVGFKPTQKRIPRQGVFPLAESLDSVGPIATSVACCALLDAVMAGDRPEGIREMAVRGLRLAIPTSGWVDGLDPIVGRAYEHALSRLSVAGTILIPHDFAAFKILEQVEELGGLIGPEAYANHRALLAQQRRAYDPRVRSRLEMSASARAADYVDALRLRRIAIDAFDRTTYAFDAVLAPTVAMAPPRFVELEQEEEYRRINAAVRRNAAAINLLDRCALTLPCHRPGELPVGLTIVGQHGGDTRLLAIAAAIERVLSP